MNKLILSTPALKGIGVSPRHLKFKEKGKVLQLKEQQETHYLDFNDYRQDLRIDYSAGNVEKNFKRVQRIIGLPDENSNAVFLSVKLKGKNADWITANNACNAFEMKIKRMFWKRKWNYINNFIGSVEYDKEYLTYHFHSILILKEIKLNLNKSEIQKIIIDILKSLEETNEKNADMVKYRMFPFSLKTRELGETIHYVVKTSTKQYDPLVRTILSYKKQLQLKQL